MRLLLIFFLIPALNLLAESGSIRVPDGGISPQCVTDSKGLTHVVYYKGNPQSGDLYYSTIQKGSTDFGPSIRVNSQAGSAVAMGTIRAAHLALGKDNAVHIVWNASQKAKGQFLYSRSIDGKSFSPQKDMKGKTAHMDGGGSIAANSQGHVFVVWHGNKAGTAGEENRRVFVARSNDNGESFSPETEISPNDLGICPCCSLKAGARGNEVLILFRGAKGASRDIYQLHSNDGGLTFSSSNLSKWRAQQCPMSSQSINSGSKGFVKAWENDGKIFFTNQSGKVMSIPGKGNKKHPFIVENSKGNLLIAWAEGTAWNRGGDLCWQEVSPVGVPLTKIERAKDQVKVWSLLSAFSDGEKFYILH